MGAGGAEVLERGLRRVAWLGAVAAGPLGEGTVPLLALAGEVDVSRGYPSWVRRRVLTGALDRESAGAAEAGSGWSARRQGGRRREPVAVQVLRGPAFGGPAAGAAVGRHSGIVARSAHRAVRGGRARGCFLARISGLNGALQQAGAQRRFPLAVLGLSGEVVQLPGVGAKVIELGDVVHVVGV